MNKWFKNRKFLVGVIVVALLAIPIIVYAQIDNHRNPSNQSTIVTSETLSSLEEAQEKVDFPIMVPSYLPGNMELAKRGICYEGTLGPSPSISLMYQDLSNFRKGDIESIASLQVYQARYAYEQVDIEKDIERIRDEEDEYVDGKKYYEEIEIQGEIALGGIALWTPYGMASCEQGGDKSTCHLNSKHIRVNWWAENGVYCTIIARNVPPEEVLKVANSLGPLK
jgi:hypothetical protein